MWQTVETGFKLNTESCFCHHHGDTIDRFEQDAVFCCPIKTLNTKVSYLQWGTWLFLLWSNWTCSALHVHEPVLVFGNHLFLSADFGPMKMTHPKLWNCGVSFEEVFTRLTSVKTFYVTNAIKVQYERLDAIKLWERTEWKCLLIF